MLPVSCFTLPEKFIEDFLGWPIYAGLSVSLAVHHDPRFALRFLPEKQLPHLVRTNARKIECFFLSPNLKFYGYGFPLANEDPIEGLDSVRRIWKAKPVVFGVL
jgi:hypothetical protein